MHHEVTLYMNIFLLIVSVQQTFANLIVLIAYFRSEKCRKEDGIILLVSLASIDFLYAILFIPYVIYLLIGWVSHGASYNYNPKIILATGGLPAALMKSGCVLTAFIAIDRNIALYLPAKYYRFEKKRILHYAYMFALLMGIIDECVLFMSTSVEQHPECLIFQCFTSPHFQIYWGMSNMFVNILSCALTVVVLIGLRRVINSISKNKFLEKKRNADKSATRTALCILAISAIFGVIPGLINGCATFLKLESLSNIGFIVGACASVSGLSHAFIFAMAHRNIRQAIVEIFGGEKFRLKISKKSRYPTAVGYGPWNTAMK